MPLAYLPEGKSGVVVDIYASKKLATKLRDMGLVRGTKVKVLKSSKPGPILIEVKGSKLAVGRGISMKVIVKV